MPKKRIIQDLAKKQFGFWIAEFYTGWGYWDCLCVCGTRRAIHNKDLLKGRSIHCGCKRVILIPSRRLKLCPTYITWQVMRLRVNDPRCRSYRYYGAKGITICERWTLFENFLADMGRRPEGMTIERIDSNKGYEPSNCKWDTIQNQSRNRKSTVWLTFQGKTLCMLDWARRQGLNVRTLQSRLKRGWSVEKALTTKPH